MPTVTIDGKPVGTTPIAAFRLRPGRHMVSFEGPGGRSLQKQVDIQPGKTERLYVKLPPQEEEAQ